MDSVKRAQVQTGVPGVKTTLTKWSVVLWLDVACSSECSAVKKQKTKQEKCNVASIESSKIKYSCGDREIVRKVELMQAHSVTFICPV